MSLESHRQAHPVLDSPRGEEAITAQLALSPAAFGEAEQSATVQMKFLTSLSILLLLNSLAFWLVSLAVKNLRK